MEEEAIALENGKYWDSSSIVHNKQNLKEKLLLPYVLYENWNGTTGAITLNDSVDNYQYIEVYGGVNGISSFQKLYKPNSQKFCVRINYIQIPSVAENIDLLSTYLIQNNKISPILNECGYSAISVNGSAAFYYVKTNYFNILRVVGYK